MPVFKFIANLTTGRRFRNLEQDQNEALIDALTAAKVIDGELHPAEAEELLESMEMLDWKGGHTVDRYIDMAVGQAEGIKATSEELLPFFEGISERLGEDWLRQETYYLSSRVALADDIVVEQERVFLQAMVQAFGIDSERQQLIIRKIRNEIDMN